VRWPRRGRIRTGARKQSCNQPNTTQCNNRKKTRDVAVGKVARGTHNLATREQHT
jgi:hypothetical protein